eukprot:SAG25_NODE_984_length_4411_cov_2.250000_8_plen_110_part_00
MKWVVLCVAGTIRSCAREAKHTFALALSVSYCAAVTTLPLLPMPQLADQHTPATRLDRRNTMFLVRHKHKRITELKCVRHHVTVTSLSLLIQPFKSLKLSACEVTARAA